MKALHSETSRRFWIWGFVFLFLLHAFVIFWLADRRGFTPLSQKPAAFFYLSGDPGTDERLGETMALRDPTLFALPQAEGFSGGAWLKFRPPPLKLTNWSTPPESLALSVEQLGGSLHDYVATNQPFEEQLLASLRATKPVAVRIPDQPIITQTIVKVEGPLAARKLISAPTLASALHTDLLRRTVVTVSVNSDGVVETATVASEPGLKAADGEAVRLARLFTFEPSSIRDAQVRELAPRTVGRLVFTWHVVTSTNAPPATASLP